MSRKKNIIIAPPPPTLKQRRAEQNKKVSDAEMEVYLRNNMGLFAQTAKAIQIAKGVPYTRVEVKKWADAHPDVTADIKQSALDMAEGGLVNLMNKAADPIKLRAIELFLKTQGKARGYVERQETELLTNSKIIVNIV